MGKNSRLAEIEYHGVAGSSHGCQSAVMRLLQCRYPIEQVLIISSSGSHCLLLMSNLGDIIAIKCGFGSGYRGAGPRCFASTLSFIQACHIEIDECEVDLAILNRLDESALTKADLKVIKKAQRIRPYRWYSYIDDFIKYGEDPPWTEFEPVIPFAIIDPRIMNLAISFWDNPDASLMTGYRQLEDIIRKRINYKEHDGKLFNRAFMDNDSFLYWSNIDKGEKAGRANLFIGAYLAHRNPRAHSIKSQDTEKQLDEFLLLNHLYRLEREAKRNKSKKRSHKAALKDIANAIA